MLASGHYQAQNDIDDDDWFDLAGYTRGVFRPRVFFDDGTGNIDRSALNDRNQDGRGLSDREQSDLTDKLQPTKVKGQFTPGGPMPSITLKGVSIKGTSKVAYEEATTAAQADAQSALSQEKVPRAYQGAVKDYFDDLKK